VQAAPAQYTTEKPQKQADDEWVNPLAEDNQSAQGVYSAGTDPVYVVNN
jgi:hypothetical protein